MERSSFVTWGLLILAGCAPTADPTLDLSVSPSSVRSREQAQVKALAIGNDGKVGRGTVTFTSAAGSLREPVTLDLDTFGTATADFVCDDTLDTLCKDKVRLVATWGKTTTAIVLTIEPPAPNTELACANGLDDDEDGTTDCLDADCQNQLCDDGLKCTSDERCANSRCSGGMPVVCDAPADPTCASDRGTCDPSLGCVYPAKNIGLSCNDGNPCTVGDVCTTTGNCTGTPRSCDSPPSNSGCWTDPGTCDRNTGLCRYDRKPDGTRCQGIPAPGRCCGGDCASIVVDPFNCGGCGVVCGLGCRDAHVSDACTPPPLTTGLCVCTTDANCRNNEHCVSGRCSKTSCLARQVRGVEDGVCPGFCEYR